MKTRDSEVNNGGVSRVALSFRTTCWHNTTHSDTAFNVISSVTFKATSKNCALTNQQTQWASIEYKLVQFETHERLITRKREKQNMKCWDFVFNKCWQPWLLLNYFRHHISHVYIHSIREKNEHFIEFLSDLNLWLHMYECSSIFYDNESKTRARFNHHHWILFITTIVHTMTW